MTVLPVVIDGAVRHYAWGRVDGLTPWTGLADGSPQAELWYGAHPTAPSPVADDSGHTLLDLWPGAAAPLLVKLLAAATPLSLQVHPGGPLAAKWLTDPETSDLMSDPAEKTELLVALEPFVVLVGWRPARTAAAILRAVGAPAEVVEAVAAGRPQAAVRLLLGGQQVHADVETWRRATEQATAGEPGHDAAVRAVTAVAESFGGDPGVAVAALLHGDELQPGDAVYVPAGVPHAYVNGLGVEVMNSSDNVLRMGLTSKRMSVEHALAAVDLERTARVLRAPADRCYAPAGAPFLLTIIDRADAVVPSGEYRLVLALTGECTVTVGPGSYPLHQGQALAVPAVAGAAHVTTAGRAVVVAEEAT